MKKTTTKTITVKGFKAFHPGLYCTGDGQHLKQYKENTVFEEKGAPELCMPGIMHFCQNPLHAFCCYSPVCETGLTEYASVEALGKVLEDGREKSGTAKLKINKKINLAQLLEAGYSYLVKKAKKKYGVKVVNWKEPVKTRTNLFSTMAWNDFAIVVAGDKTDLPSVSFGVHSTAIGRSGYSLAINKQVFSAAVNYGDCSGALTEAGGSSAEIYGEHAAAVCRGQESAAVCLGNDSIAMVMHVRSVSVSIGNFSAAVCQHAGSAAVCIGLDNMAIAEAPDSLAIQLGDGGKCKGVKGSWLVLAEWDEAFKKIKAVKAVLVDDEKIKAGAFYQLRDGEIRPCPMMV